MSGSIRFQSLTPYRHQNPVKPPPAVTALLFIPRCGAQTLLPLCNVSGSARDDAQSLRDLILP